MDIGRFVEFMSRPPVLATAAVILVSAAYFFLRSCRSGAPKGGYSKVLHRETASSNESESRSHRFAGDEVLKVFPEAPHVDTLHAILKETAEKRAEFNAVATRKHIDTIKETKKVNGEDKVWEFPQLGHYEWMTYKELYEKVNNFGSALAQIGLKRGDRLAIFEETRFEWTLAAHGAWRQGMSILTVYANLGEEALAYALALGEVTTLLLNAKGVSTIVSAKANIPTLKTIIYVDPIDNKHKEAAKAQGLEVYSVEEFMELGKKNPVEADPPKPSDVAMIMFTSGTTGMPKGVVLTHGNVVGAIAGACQVLVKAVGLDVNKDSYISYLPLAHILALVVHSALFYIGIPIGYGSPRSLTDSSVRNCKGDLREMQPTLFVGVPTVYERIKAGVERKIKASPASAAIFNAALKAKVFMNNWGIPGTGLLDLVVFNKLKREVGGKIRIFVSGGAALSPPVQEFMENAFGIRTIQGYGLTETAGPACVQEPTDFTRGSVGSPMPSCEVKLVDVPEMNYLHTSNPPRGEVWIRGSHVSSGYFKNEEETNKAFVNGWFRTGDVGEWTSEGSLKIIDRIKNLIKPPHGEYIALESIESRYRNCEFVEHICVYVDSEHNDIVAVVSPNKGALENWASKNGHNHEDMGHLCKSAEVTKAVLKALQATGRQHKLKSIETIRALHLTADEWTPDNDLLTAAQKLKRNNIVKAYKEEIDKMYASLGSD